MHLRDVQPHEHVFVADAWARSLEPYGRSPGIHPQEWARLMHRGIRSLLADPTTVALGLELVDDELTGFAVATPGSTKNLLHYVYTKQDFRRQGFGRALVDELEARFPGPWVYACTTPAGRRLIREEMARAG